MLCLDMLWIEFCNNLNGIYTIAIPLNLSNLNFQAGKTFFEELAFFTTKYILFVVYLTVYPRTFLLSLSSTSKRAY